MSGIVFAAVLLAALLHATWNALLKGGADKDVSMAAIVIGHVPLAILALPLVPLPAIEALPWLVAGVLLHLGYQLFLIAGYRIGDLTQVYPIARGVAPLIVALVSTTVLGVVLGRAELVAVGLIAIGIVSLALVGREDRAWNPRAVGFALATGCFIAAYSIVDGLGARVAGSALSYWVWAALGNAGLFTLWTMVVRPGVLSRTLDRPVMIVGIVGGSASFIAYALVVWAFTSAPIALVTALRETSIVFALLIGVGVLGERLSLGKVAATAMTVLGVVLLRLSRAT